MPAWRPAPLPLPARPPLAHTPRNPWAGLAPSRPLTPSSQTSVWSRLFLLHPQACGHTPLMRHPSPSIPQADSSPKTPSLHLLSPGIRKVRPVSTLKLAGGPGQREREGNGTKMSLSATCPQFQ